MNAQLHGALICAGISAGALAIVGIGCAVLYVCGAIVDRHVDQALGTETFAADTEAAVAQALAVANDDRPSLADLARWSGRFSTTPVPDQLAARRHARTVTR